MPGRPWLWFISGFSLGAITFSFMSPNPNFVWVGLNVTVLLVVLLIAWYHHRSEQSKLPW